jgi:hypothetical protein
MTATQDLPPRPANTIQAMRITFWGVQGSCPILPAMQDYARTLAHHALTRAFEDLAGNSEGGAVRLDRVLGGPVTPAAIEAYQQRLNLPALPIYGGETTCIEVETAEGDILIFDLGSGVRRCSHSILDRWKTKTGRTLHVFGSHEHLDHRMGLTFARICYVHDNPFTVNVYGTYQFLHALDQHYGLFSRQVSELTYVDDPVDYTAMGAAFHGIELHRGEESPPERRFWRLHDIQRPVCINGTTVIPFEVYHGSTACLAYRVEHGGKSFLFSTDHELRRGDAADRRQQRSAAAEQRLLQHCQNADVAYFDGQYLLDEYLGKKGVGPYPPLSRMDWGHGCIEDIVERAAKAHIRQAFVGHHDPERAWIERLQIDQRLADRCADKPYRVRLADSDRIVDV